MQFHPLALIFAATFLSLPFSATAAGPAAWPEATSQTRPWAYWWWMGSAADNANITRELERYHEAGLGGVHIIPIYGAKGFESNYVAYLSPKWMELMSWSVTEAKRLGMGVDMTTGTGWCFGGPKVSDDDANASVTVRTFDVPAGEKLAEKFDTKKTQALMAFSPDGKSVELTKKISADGSVDWTAPAGSWKVYSISQKPSGQKVKRPAPGGEGWMLNLFYPQAMTNFLKWFGAPFENYSGAKPRSQYHDSYEYKSDWSPDFFAEFEKRRGYKLQNELPSLFSTNRDDRAARVLCDYRETVSDIMAEETLPQWVKWSHDHGFITREEAHGSPGNWLDLYATADIPETEFFSKHRNILVSKFASSAAHVKGGNLASSESCTWIAEHFTETLADAKFLMDDLFLSGINHVFYHGCCYSPDEAGWPGWHFYASLEMNPRNSIWHDASTLNNYITRVQSVLQSGKSDNDILLYWPIQDFWMQPGGERLPQLRVEAQGWFTDQPVGKTAKELWDRGYAFDYISDRQIAAAKTANGRVQTGGAAYRAIVVPDCQNIPVTTLSNLLTLARDGATVIFQNQLPSDVPGWNRLDQRRSELNALLAKMHLSDTGENFGEGKTGKGRVMVGALETALVRAGAWREPLTDAGLSFVRRSGPGGRAYFIANRTATNFDGWIPLAAPAKKILIMDALNGQTGLAAVRTNAKKQTEARLQLPPGASLIVRAITATNDFAAAAWNYPQPGGAAAEIKAAWKLHFISGGPALPADSELPQTASWTTLADTNAQYFSGSAKYETTFDAPDPQSTIRNPQFFLNLGDVRQSARVKLNGKDYGTLITPPFRVVVDNLKPSGNVLEVEVTSTSANRIRDLDRRGVKWKTFRDINFVDIGYKPFDASGWPLADSGLLGPVTLTPVAAEQ